MNYVALAVKKYFQLIILHRFTPIDNFYLYMNFLENLLIYIYIYTKNLCTKLGKRLFKIHFSSDLYVDHKK